MVTGKDLFRAVGYIEKVDDGAALVYEQLTTGAQIILDRRRRAVFATLSGQPCGLSFGEIQAAACRIDEMGVLHD